MVDSSDDVSHSSRYVDAASDLHDDSDSNEEDHRRGQNGTQNEQAISPTSYNADWLSDLIGEELLCHKLSTLIPA